MIVVLHCLPTFHEAMENANGSGDHKRFTQRFRENLILIAFQPHISFAIIRHELSRQRLCLRLQYCREGLLHLYRRQCMLPSSLRIVTYPPKGWNDTVQRLGVYSHPCSNPF